MTTREELLIKEAWRMCSHKERRQLARVKLQEMLFNANVIKSSESRLRERFRDFLYEAMQLGECGCTDDALSRIKHLASKEYEKIQAEMRLQQMTSDLADSRDNPSGPHDQTEPNTTNTASAADFMTEKDTVWGPDEVLSTRKVVQMVANRGLAAVRGHINPNICDESYWVAIVQDKLSIRSNACERTGTDTRNNHSSSNDSASLCGPDTLIQTASLLQSLSHSGYFVSPPLLRDTSLLTRLRESIDLLGEQGWPPAFVLLYDEFWAWIGATLWPLMQECLGPSCSLEGSLFAWVASRDEGDTKLGGNFGLPHRDYCYSASNFPDGSPKLLTVWVPLTDATLDTGCMYVVPKDLDADFNADWRYRHMASAVRSHRWVGNLRPAPEGGQTNKARKRRRSDDEAPCQPAVGSTPHSPELDRERRTTAGDCADGDRQLGEQCYDRTARSDQGHIAGENQIGPDKGGVKEDVKKAGGEDEEVNKGEGEGETRSLRVRERVLEVAFDLDRLRPLPARAGSVLAWHGNLVHFGSRCSRGTALTPRYSVGMTFRRGDAEALADDRPLSRSDVLSIPFERRLTLVLKSLWMYRQWHSLSPRTLPNLLHG